MDGEKCITANELSAYDPSQTIYIYSMSNLGTIEVSGVGIDKRKYNYNLTTERYTITNVQPLTVLMLKIQSFGTLKSANLVIGNNMLSLSGEIKLLSITSNASWYYISFIVPPNGTIETNNEYRLDLVTY